MGWLGVAIGKRSVHKEPERCPACYERDMIMLVMTPHISLFRVADRMHAWMLRQPGKPQGLCQFHWDTWPLTAREAQQEGRKKNHGVLAGLHKAIWGPLARRVKPFE